MQLSARSVLLLPELKVIDDHFSGEIHMYTGMSQLRALEAGLRQVASWAAQGPDAQWEGPAARNFRAELAQAHRALLLAADCCVNAQATALAVAAQAADIAASFGPSVHRSLGAGSLQSWAV